MQFKIEKIVCRATPSVQKCMHYHTTEQSASVKAQTLTLGVVNQVLFPFLCYVPLLAFLICGFLPGCITTLSVVCFRIYKDLGQIELSMKKPQRQDMVFIKKVIVTCVLLDDINISAVI